MKLGKFEIHILSDGTFRLDGGAIFGIIPKTLWSKSFTPDEKNTILLSLNSLLVKTPEEIILIDTGIGNKFSEKFVNIYGIDHNKTDLLKELKKLNIEPKDINKVILTHLHFDHCGWNTIYNDKGELVPTFNNAQYFINKSEWEYAFSPDPKSKGTFLIENLKPIQDFNQLNLIENNIEISEGIETIVSGGHTKFHQIIKIKSENEIACFLGDLIPTVSHLKNTYVTAYDLEPLQTINFKEKLINQALLQNWFLIFGHDPSIKGGYINYKDGKFLLS